MTNLVTVEANALLEASSGKTTYPAPTTPMKVALVTVIGTATSAGTKVTGGSYADQTATYASASAQSIATNAALTYTGMPVATVVGTDEYDSAGTPVRKWFGPLTANKTTNSGDTLSIGIGAYSKAFT